MTTLRIQKITCPHCQKKMHTIGVMSYTIRNSEIFSDGKITNNHLSPAIQNILICYYCYKAFWKNNVVVDDKTDNLSDNLPNASSPRYLFPGLKPENCIKLANYYFELLNKGFANTKKRTIFLRLELWRTLNDIVRYKQKPMPEDLLVLFKNNLLELLKIFNPKNEEEQLLLVEMYRELEYFEKAKQLLKENNWTENNLSFQQIKNAVNNNKSIVFKLTYN